MNARKAVVASALLFVLVGVGWSARRVAQLESAELDFRSPPRTLKQAATATGATAVSARLGSVRLDAGKHTVFEVCTNDAMQDGWKDALDFAVFQLKPLELVLRVPLDQAHLDVVKRNDYGACLALGGGELKLGGVYAVDAVWPGRKFPDALAQHSLRMHVLARQPLERNDRFPVLMIAFGALWLLIGLFLTRGRSELDPIPAATGASSTMRHMSALGIGLVVLVAGWFASAYLGPFGPTWGLLKTAALAAVEVAAAVALVRLGEHASSSDLLSLHRPMRRPWLALIAAPIVGVLLSVSARLCLSLVPSTGESAIETFISWPSGLLAFGAIGLLAPVCEELFFRGFVYRRTLALGNIPAFLITVTSFVALHGAQTWGNWGSLLSITITGVVLTGLRAGTGSTLIPALAHIVYNLTLTLRSL